jgi:hypothetical protein
VATGRPGWSVDETCSNRLPCVVIEAQPLPPPSSPHGRGLFLVDRLADEWGVSPAADGPERSVWFRVAMRSGQGMRS